MPAAIDTGIFNRAPYNMGLAKLHARHQLDTDIINQSREHAKKVLQAAFPPLPIKESTNEVWRNKLFLNADKILYVKAGDDIPINGFNSRWINVFYDFKFIGKIYVYSNLERDIIEVTTYFCKKFADYDFSHGKLIKYCQYTLDAVRNNIADKELRSMLFKNCPMLNNRSTNLGETFNTASLSSNQERRVFKIDVSDIPTNQVDAYMEKISNEIRSNDKYKETWRKLSGNMYGIQGSITQDDLPNQLSKEEQLDNAIAYFDAIKASNNYSLPIKKELINGVQYRILDLFIQFKSKFRDFIQEDSIVDDRKIFDDGINILLTYDDIEYNITITDVGVYCDDNDHTFSINGLYNFIHKPQTAFSKIYTKIKEWALNRMYFYYNCVT